MQLFPWLFQRLLAWAAPPLRSSMATLKWQLLLSPLFSGAKRQPQGMPHWRKKKKYNKKGTGNFVAKQSTNRYEYTWDALALPLPLPLCVLYSFFHQLFLEHTFVFCCSFFFAHLASVFPHIFIQLAAVFFIRHSKLFSLRCRLNATAFVYPAQHFQHFSQPEVGESSLSLSLDACRANACHARSLKFFPLPCPIPSPCGPLWQLSGLMTLPEALSGN